MMTHKVVVFLFHFPNQFKYWKTHESANVAPASAASAAIKAIAIDTVHWDLGRGQRY